MNDPKKLGISRRQARYFDALDSFSESKQNNKLQQATEELWAKIQDMQAGQPLTQAEWLMIIARLERRIANSTEVSA